MTDDTAIRIVISPQGVQGLDIRGPLREHPAALRLAGAVLPAVALLDAMIRDFSEVEAVGGKAVHR